MRKLFLLLIFLILIGCQKREDEIAIPSRDKVAATNFELNDVSEKETPEEIFWYTNAEITSAVKSDDHDQLATRVDSFLENQQFNGVVLVAVEDEIIILNAYGLANVEEERPLTVDTQFQIGSVSKPFLAISILQLVEAGILDLEQTIDYFFPDLERGSEITIHQLLTHASGLNCGDNLNNYSLFTTTDELIADAFKNIHYHQEPGTFIYSNLGYDLLGVIIEKVTNLTYEEYIQNNILNRVNMNASGLNTAGIELENLATAYAGHITQGEPARVFHPSFGYSSGGLHSTALDLFKFSQALYHDILLSTESYELMTTAHSTINGTGYGYGWFINSRNQEGVISHNGDLLGWHSALLHHQDNEFTVILLTNQSGSARNLNMAHSIVSMVLEN